MENTDFFWMDTIFEADQHFALRLNAKRLQFSSVGRSGNVSEYYEKELTVQEQSRFWSMIDAARLDKLQSNYLSPKPKPGEPRLIRETDDLSVWLSRGNKVIRIHVSDTPSGPAVLSQLRWELESYARQHGRRPQDITAAFLATPLDVPISPGALTGESHADFLKRTGVVFKKPSEAFLQNKTIRQALESPGWIVPATGNATNLPQPLATPVHLEWLGRPLKLQQLQL